MKIRSSQVSFLPGYIFQVYFSQNWIKGLSKSYHIAHHMKACELYIMNIAGKLDPCYLGRINGL